MRNLPAFITISMITVALAACGGRKVAKEDEAIPPPPVPEPVVVVTGEAGASGLQSDDSLAGSELDEGAIVEEEVATFDPLNQRVVYFEYDSSNLGEDARSIIQAHAQYLASAPGTQIILEGHADERGTREYNLSLGEDRAQSVAEVMRGSGVNADDIQTISYGEERPVSLGSDESAWSLNRRVEILYQ